MRCLDDCVAIKSMDHALKVDSVRVTNCVMVGWSCSDGVTCTAGGKPVRSIADADYRINEYTSNIVYLP